MFKLDSSGNLLWEKVFGTYPYASGVFSVKETPDKGFVTLGYTTETDPWLNFQLTKLDSNGNVKWKRIFGRSYDETGMHVEVTADGGFLLVGRSGYWGPNDQAWIIKTDSSGNKEWEKVWGAGMYDEAYGVTQTFDGGYAVVGAANFQRNGRPADGFVLKLNSYGEEQWSKIFGGDYYDDFQDVCQADNGNLIIIGYQNNRKGWLVELDEHGNLLKEDYLGNASTSLFDVTCGETSYKAIIGYTNYQTAGGYDIYLNLNGISDEHSEDFDEDNIIDAEDNCPDIYNPDQADNDQDGIGDICDEDDDNDTVIDDEDNCSLIVNTDQQDTDFDTYGDVCDVDDDNDYIFDEDDNCPLFFNTEQEDFDTDGLGDVCDSDDDNDGINDENDSCQFENPEGKDSNLDGCIDTVEKLPSVIESLQLPNGIENSLLKQTKNLKAFINHVEAQRGKKLSGSDADMLIDFANNILK